MTTTSVRDQLNRQLNDMPDDLVAEIADFTAFVLARRQLPAPYLEWTAEQWRTLSLSQFLRETSNDVEYTIEDAEEVYSQ